MIATFTIPKILVAQQNQQKNAQAKEAAAMIAAAYDAYKTQNPVPVGFKPSDLLPYMNYVALVTDGRTVDWTPFYAALSCTSGAPCVILHGGAILRMRDGLPFDAVNSTTPLEFIYDPDGVYSGSTADSPGKSVQFELYYNGKLTSRAFSERYGTGPYDPSWFNWN